jgi:tetratricopeptide (TPR) repeat protein
VFESRTYHHFLNREGHNKRIQCCNQAKAVIPLPHPDSHFLNAATGWLELGSAIEAREELARIAPKYQLHPDVLAVRWSIHAKEEKWELAFEVATAFTRVAPEMSQGWVDLSISHYRLGRTQAAWDGLAAVENKFADEWLVFYNLACYAAQLGNLDGAIALIQKAMKLGDEYQIRKLVMNDPDLIPIRNAFRTEQA